MGVKFGMEEGTEGPNFTPIGATCNVSPLRGEKPQNRPLSKLNTGRFALRAMMPVIICYNDPISSILIHPTVWPQYTNVTDTLRMPTGVYSGPIA